MKMFLFFRADTEIIKSNISVLIAEGLGPRSENDFKLARDTCLALLKIGINKKVSRYLDGVSQKNKKKKFAFCFFCLLDEILISLFFLNFFHLLCFLRKLVT